MRFASPPVSLQAIWLKLPLTALFILGFSTPALAQMPTIVPGENHGSIIVYVSGEYGKPLSVPVDMRLTPTLFGDPEPVFPREVARGWLFDDLAAGNTYSLDIEAKGYQSVHQTITLADISGVSQSVIVYMKPVDENLVFHAPSGQFALTPHAQREVQSGLKDFQSRKFPSGEKHLAKALQSDPGNPYVNYVAGLGYLLNQQLALAQPYLEKSVSIDARQVPALIALGNLQFQKSDYAGAIRVLTRAVELDPSSWKSHWILADCYLHEQNFQAAREHATKALEFGKGEAQQVQLLLGEALAGLGDRQGARAAVETFLAANPHYPTASSIKSWLAALDTPPPAPAAPSHPVMERTAAFAPSAPGSPGIALSSPLPVAPRPALELPPKEDWAPKDIDAETPVVLSGVSCSLPKVLDMAAKSAEKVVDNLQKFEATEQSEIVEVKRNKSLETPLDYKSTYMALIDRSDPKTIQVQELRSPAISPGELPGGIMDVGAPVLVLAFHPIYRNSFAWSCEGLGEWKDHPAWIVRFSQKPERPTALLSAFETLTERYPLPLKGRAWISANGGEIMHLETDLTQPLKSIELVRQHFIVDYAPVPFRNRKITLWLPEDVNLYLQYQHHYLHYYHHYSNFTLFWVGTSEKIGSPKQSKARKTSR